MFVKNTWYVAAWGTELDADSLLDRTIAGDRLVFFRDGDGNASALRNRCCHRSAPLSMGAREGDGIRCGYHGLKFDRSGACVEIPGQAVIPPNARVDSFPVTERYGWIWVWTGDAALADPALIPEMREMANADWNRLTGYLHYDTNYQLIHDNLLDFSHISYVHAATFGGGNSKWADELPALKKLDDGFAFERWMENVPPAPFLHSILGDQIRQDILNVYDFHMNGALTIETSVQIAGTGTREKMSDIGFLRTYSWQAVTPATEHTTHYFFSTGLEKHWPQQVLDIMQAGTHAAFEEDRRMIGAQQALLLQDDGEPKIAGMATAHDRALNQMRGMIKRQVEVEASAKIARAG